MDGLQAGTTADRAAGQRAVGEGRGPRRRIVIVADIDGIAAGAARHVDAGFNAAQAPAAVGLVADIDGVVAVAGRDHEVGQVAGALHVHRIGPAERAGVVDVQHSGLETAEPQSPGVEPENAVVGDAAVGIGDLGTDISGLDANGNVLDPIDIDLLGQQEAGIVGEGLDVDRRAAGGVIHVEAGDQRRLDVGAQGLAVGFDQRRDVFVVKGVTGSTEAVPVGIPVGLGDVLGGLESALVEDLRQHGRVGIVEPAHRDGFELAVAVGGDAVVGVGVVGLVEIVELGDVGLLQRKGIARRPIDHDRRRAVDRIADFLQFARAIGVERIVRGHRADRSDLHRIDAIGIAAGLGVEGVRLVDRRGVPDVLLVLVGGLAVAGQRGVLPIDLERAVAGPGIATGGEVGIDRFQRQIVAQRLHRGFERGGSQRDGRGTAGFQAGEDRVIEQRVEAVEREAEGAGGVGEAKHLLPA